MQNIRTAISEWLEAQPLVEEKFGVKIERDVVTV